MLTQIFHRPSCLDDPRSSIAIPKIAGIACYWVAMIRFIFDLGIELATFVASAVAFFRKPGAGLRARNRPWGWSLQFPAGFPGRRNVLPDRRAADLAQVVDLTRDYRQSRADFGAEMKILPDLREREPPPRSEHAQPEDSVDGVEAGQHALADQVAQGLGRAAAERAVAGAAVEARDRELVGEAVAAMHLDRFARDPQGHLVAIDLGDCGQQRVGERVGAGAGAVEHAAPDLDVLVHLGDLPAHALKLADRAAERSAFLDVAHRFFERTLGEAQGDARVEAALRVEGRQQFAKPVLAQHQVLGRQEAILEADLVQVFAAHRVIGAGDRKAGGALLDQDAADAGAAGLAVDAGEDDEHLGLLGPADQRLYTIEPQCIAGRVDIGLIVGDIGAGIWLGHADRQDGLATAHRRQDARLDPFWRVGGDDPGLHPDLAEHGHRGYIACLGDFLEDEGGVEYPEAKPAIFLRDGHSEHTQPGERAHVLPREGAVHVLHGARPELALGQVADGLHKATLLVG